MYNLAALSPEEKDDLLNQLIAKYDGAGSDPADSTDHPDAVQDQAMLDPYREIIQMLASKLEDVEGRMYKVESMVVDDLFGGIDRLYKSNVRAKGIDDMRGKYGDIFNPHVDAIRELSPEDADGFWDKIYDLVEEMKSEEGFNDEVMDERLKGAASSIGEKIAKLKGDSAPVAVEVEAAEVKAAPAEGQADEKLLEKVRGMKQKATSYKGGF
jgi:hypothetical protein